MGTGFIIAGRREQPPIIDIENFLDNPQLRLTREDSRPRAADAWIHVVVLHTTKGIPFARQDPRPPILPGFGPKVDAGLRCSRYWSGDGRNAGAHLVVDFDGTISQCADLQTDTAWHAVGWNHCSIGIEIYQGADGELYEGQLERVVQLVDAITARFEIQRQVPEGPYTRALPRFLDHVGNDYPATRDTVGVIGHRECSNQRGMGDPGSRIFQMLHGHGYEDYDFELSLERDEWRRRQRKIGIKPPDGVAGPATAAALKANGHPRGLWVSRPGDEVPWTVEP